MGQNVIYIGELDMDVDDVIAAEYLNRKRVLKAVVCDPLPKTDAGKKRQKSLESLGIPVLRKLPSLKPDDCVFIGGALTELARYLVAHKIGFLAMNGGFVGDNLAKEPLPKFKGKMAMRTFNFNCDVDAADRVLRSKNIGTILLVGKNVCHDPRNTGERLWEAERGLLQKYHVRPGKLQHDMLACHEGLVMAGILDEEPYCSYMDVYPYHTGLKGNRTCWGSKEEPTGYRMVKAAVGWR